MSTAVGLGLAVGAAGCGGEAQPMTMEDAGGGDVPDLTMTAQPDLTMTTPPDMTGPRLLLKRESRSSAIAISDDDRIVGAVSPDDDKLFLIDTTMGNKASAVTLPKGCEPRSIAFSPDSSFWVACRNLGAIVQVKGLTAGSGAMVGTPIAVGGEPAGVAVTPSGAKVAVAAYADGAVVIVDAAAGKVLTSVDVGRNPRALAISNGHGNSDDAETIYVTRMFGEPIAGGPGEGNDTGREGLVVPIPVGAATAGTALKLAPIADSTFAVANTAGMMIPVGAYPNQLQSVVLKGNKLFIPSTAASPTGPVNFAGNVHPMVSVYDLAGNKELPFGTSGMLANTLCATSVNNQKGYAAGTLDLAIQTRDLNGMAAPPPVIFPTNPVDIAMVPNDAVFIGYVVSMASDAVTRVVWDFATNTACAGSAVAKQINLQAAKGDIKVPIGMVIRNDGSLGYVNSWVGREVEVIDFSTQAVSARVALSAQPAGGNDAVVQKGKKFFWTSTGRWSNNGWGSCGSCHPDGITDGVTWVFNTGPRQTLGLDSDYGKKQDGTPDPTDQRILNWTAVFDEIHDFENNTRGVSGGLGAVVSAGGKQIDLAATKDNNLNGSVKQLAADGMTPRALVGGGTDVVDVANASDWDAIDAYTQTLRSMNHGTKSDPTSDAVKRGKALFEQGKCANCHSGAKWTSSRRFYTPTQGAAAGSSACSLQTTPLAKKSVPVGGNVPQTTESFHLQTERPGNKACMVVGDCGGTPGVNCVNGFCTVAPQRLTCSLRNVGTFGSGAQGAKLEIRSDTNMAGVNLVGEGANGYNVPSLLSLSATAPYFHNGAALTLVDLLTNASYRGHATAGNPNFTVDAAGAADLSAFLLSIDQSTPPYAVDGSLDLCVGFMMNNNACTNP